MIADITIIVIMLLCVFLGYIRGFAKVAIKIIGFVASLVIALILYTPISNYIINNTDIVNNLQTSIQGKIYSGNQEEEKEHKEENITEVLQNYINDYTDGIKSSSAEYIANSIAITIVRARNMDRTIYSSKSFYDNIKIIFKYYRENSSSKTI